MRLLQVPGDFNWCTISYLSYIYIVNLKLNYNNFVQVKCTYFSIIFRSQFGNF